MKADPSSPFLLLWKGTYDTAADANGGLDVSMVSTQNEKDEMGISLISLPSYLSTSAGNCFWGSFRGLFRRRWVSSIWPQSSTWMRETEPNPCSFRACPSCPKRFRQWNSTHRHGDETFDSSLRASRPRYLASTSIRCQRSVSVNFIHLSFKRSRCFTDWPSRCLSSSPEPFQPITYEVIITK